MLRVIARLQKMQLEPLWLLKNRRIHSKGIRRGILHKVILNKDTPNKAIPNKDMFNRSKGILNRKVIPSSKYNSRCQTAALRLCPEPESPDFVKDAAIVWPRVLDSAKSAGHRLKVRSRVQV